MSHAPVKKHPHAGKEGPTRAFIKAVHDIAAHRRRHSDVLRDFAEVSYIAFVSPLPFTSPERRATLEDRFQSIIKRGGGPEYRQKLAELLALAADGLELGGDFFGPIMADLGALNDGLGQFFTPDPVCRLLAEMNVGDDVAEKIESQGFVTIMEPASGTGGMVIAYAEALRARGFNTATDLWATTIDVDPFCFHLCYLQLALHDISADVYLGDALRNEMREVASTPAKMRLLAYKGSRVRKYLNSAAAPREPDEMAAVPVVPPALPPITQLELFGGAK